MVGRSSISRHLSLHSPGEEFFRASLALEKKGEEKFGLQKWVPHLLRCLERRCTFESEKVRIKKPGRGTWLAQLVELEHVTFDLGVA